MRFFEPNSEQEIWVYPISQQQHILLFRCVEYKQVYNVNSIDQIFKYAVMDRFNNSGSFFVWLFFVAVSIMSFTGCGTLPARTWESSTALDLNEARQTTLGQAIAPIIAANANLTGVFTLENSRKAFATRALLSEAAEKSIDVQYYIWRNDITGTLFLNGLLDAAKRGVKVRLLLDDMNGDEPEPLLMALNSHENVEVRLFNPFIHRKVRAIDYVTALSRVNRRMHNKSFTVDNTVTIIGGRNIGDEYFGASDELMFADLDVIAIGPVVEEVSADFDRYWASESAYPLEKIVNKMVSNSSLLEQKAQKVKESLRAEQYIEALRADSAIQALIQHDLPLIWAPTYMISDDPAKGVGKSAPEALLSTRLKVVIGNATSSLTIVSAYFVPTKEGTKFLVNLAKSGVAVTILTNSLEATDVAAVHAGYARYRKRLIEAGIRLFEMQGGEDKTNMSVFGSSAASLHAKTFAVDGKRVFIGSFNFDPRSVNLNTELGFVIESPILASYMEKGFATAPQIAYQLKLNRHGDIYWLEQKNGTEIRHYKEPYTSWWKRFGVTMLSILPIEWLL